MLLWDLLIWVRYISLIINLVLKLVYLGIPLSGIEQYAKRNNRLVITPLQQIQPHKTYNMLKAGTKQNHPSHVPSHLPSFPDPHAYIRTPVSTVLKLMFSANVKT